MKQKIFFIIIFFFLGVVSGYLLRSLSYSGLPLLQLSGDQQNPGQEAEESYELTGVVIEKGADYIRIDAGSDPCRGDIEKQVVVDDNTAIIQRNYKTESEIYGEEAWQKIQELEDELSIAQGPEETLSIQKEIIEIKNNSGDIDAEEIEVLQQKIQSAQNSKDKLLLKYQLKEMTSGYKYQEADIADIGDYYLIEVFSSENVNASDQVLADLIVVKTDKN